VPPGLHLNHHCFSCLLVLTSHCLCLLNVLGAASTWVVSPLPSTQVTPSGPAVLQLLLQLAWLTGKFGCWAAGPLMPITDTSDLTPSWWQPHLFRCLRDLVWTLSTTIYNLSLEMFLTDNSTSWAYWPSASLVLMGPTHIGIII
jgi:hypothetical protein